MKHVIGSACVAVSTLCALVSSAKADSTCASLVTTMKVRGNWGSSTKTIISETKGSAQWASFSLGYVDWFNTDPVAGSFSQYFSDRTWSATSPAGTRFLTLPFNPDAADVIRIRFDSNNDIVMTLLSWGSGTFTIPVQCKGRLAYGLHDDVMYVFSFGDTFSILG